MAVGAAQIFLRAFPAAAAQNSVDALHGPLGIVWLLDGDVVKVVVVPILAPFVNVASHVVKPEPIGGIAHDGRCIGTEEIGLCALYLVACGIDEIFPPSVGSDFPFRFSG